MLSLINVLKSQPKRSLLIVAGIGVSAIALRAIWSRIRSSRRLNQLAIWKLSETCEIDARSLRSIINSLEQLLSDLERQKFGSEISRGKYDLIASIIARLQSVCSDLQKYIREDFQRVPIEDIARSIWAGKRLPGAQPHKTGTLSILSDDSFISAYDEFIPQPQLEEEGGPLVNIEALDLYKAGLAAFERGEIVYRKSRAEFCMCESEADFAAKVFALRQAFDLLLVDPHNRQWLIHAGRNIIAAIIRNDGIDPTEFYVVYDRMIAFITDPANYELIKEELRTRRVEKTNLWDVLFDLIILDAFEDLQRPPSTITALVNNSFISRTMKQSTISNLIWSMIKVKRARLKVRDGFISHFYDISQIMTCSLTMGLLGGSSRDFQEICLGFKENICQFVMDIFNFNRVRFTSVAELAEDVKRLLQERVETIQALLNSEPILLQ